MFASWVSCLVESAEEPCLLLWGVPVPLDSTDGQDFAKRLTHTIDEIQHNPQSRSEPDVVLDFGAAGVVVIEVKYTSENDLKETSHAGWPAHRKHGSVSQSGRSEDYETLRACSELADWMAVC